MTEIDIKTERPRVDELLARYRPEIGKDFDGYRNHVHRTITYAMHFLQNDSSREQLVETAFVYHDIGLWTDRALAYLEPSETLALRDNEALGWGLDPDALRGAIHWHHKVTRYRGPHQEVVEACRKADWIDATMGQVRKGMSKANVASVESAFPNFGFHKTLMRLPTDHGQSLAAGGWKVLRNIVKR